MSPFTASLLLRYTPVSLLDSSHLSPAADSIPATSDLFAGCPPCLVRGGEAEHYIEEAWELVRCMRLGGVECEYLVGEDAPHNILTLSWVSEEWQAGAMERMQAWVNKQLA